MIAKFAALICLFGIAHAGGWSGSYSSLGYPSSIGYGYGGYSHYVTPSYTAPVVTTPVVTKAVIPAYSYAPYAPTVSTVSRYHVPVVKSYVAPISYSYSPYGASYDHGYSNIGYNSLGYHTDYFGGYSGYGYGSKYLW